MCMFTRQTNQLYNKFITIYCVCVCMCVCVCVCVCVVWCVCVWCVCVLCGVCVCVVCVCVLHDMHVCVCCMTCVCVCVCEREEGSDHAATIKLSPWQKLAVSSEIVLFMFTHRMLWKHKIDSR